MRGGRAVEVQKLPRGMRQFAVLAGSEVRLTLDSDRPLKTVEVKIAEQAAVVSAADDGKPKAADAKPVEQTFLMQRGDAQAGGEEVWTLATASTPLASVAKELSYSIQIHDVEDQTLDRPLEGAVTIEPDQPPGILARTKTPIVLPTGSPNIHYEAYRRSRPGPHLADVGSHFRRCLEGDREARGPGRGLPLPAGSPPRTQEADYAFWPSSRFPCGRVIH